jgi:membrane-associated phospholipid phosphatase
MKHLDESERILTVFGAFVMAVAIGLSITTEVTARRHLAEHKRAPAGGVVQQGAERGQATVDKHIGYAVETLDTRWDFPDGHATLGVGFGLFGLMLVAVPRSVAKKRVVSA